MTRSAHSQDQDGNLDPSTQPLISRPSSSSSSSPPLPEDIPEPHLPAPTPYITSLTLAAALSGLLFGYDTGVISSTLVSLHSSLSSRLLTTWDKSLITSCTSLFALFASPITGILADAIGRRKVILIADVLFILGALVQAFASQVWQMVLGRCIIGIAVGGASFVVPLYVSETSPAQFRGRLVTVCSLFITGGQVVAYIIGWWFSRYDQGWRWMVGLGAVPAGVQGVLVLVGKVEESPRWLVKRGDFEGARRVFNKVYGGDMEGVVEGVVARVGREVEDEEGKTGGGVGETWEALVGVRGNRRALVIACMLQGFQQLCGFNSLMYFSATIFSLVGFESPTLTSLSIATTNFLFTLIAFAYIDTIGRRRILLLSIPFMILGLIACAISFNYIELPATHASSATSPLHLLSRLKRDEALGDGTHRGGGVWPLLLLASTILYVSSYALGLGNVPWQQGELFPLRVRALGSALATATNWGANFVVGVSFLPMMEWVSPSGTFAIYALVCGVAWVCVWRCYPEIKGLSLEEVGGLLAEGWGVRGRGRGQGRHVHVG